MKIYDHKRDNIIQKIFIIILILIHKSSSSLSSPPPPPPPSHVNIMFTYDYLPSLQKEFTTHGISRNLTNINIQYSKTKLPSLYRIDLEIIDFNNNNINLKSNWKHILYKLLLNIKPLLNKENSLRGIFIGDELTAQGLPYESLKLIIDFIYDKFNNEFQLQKDCNLIYYNDSIFIATWVGKYNIPWNLTHFSMDYYHGISTGRINQTVYDLYKQFVFPNLGPNTKVLFVPQAFGTLLDTRHGHTLNAYETWMMENLTNYIKWSYQDKRIVGFNPWHMLNRSISFKRKLQCATVEAGCGEIGYSAMKLLFQYIKTLGSSIISQNNIFDEHKR